MKNKTGTTCQNCGFVAANERNYKRHRRQCGKLPHIAELSRVVRKDGVCPTARNYGVRPSFLRSVLIANGYPTKADVSKERQFSDWSAVWAKEGEPCERCGILTAPSIDMIPEELRDADDHEDLVRKSLVSAPIPKANLKIMMDESLNDQQRGVKGWGNRYPNENSILCVQCLDAISSEVKV